MLIAIDKVGGCFPKPSSCQCADGTISHTTFCYCNGVIMPDYAPCGGCDPCAWPPPCPPWPNNYTCCGRPGNRAPGPVAVKIETF